MKIDIRRVEPADYKAAQQIHAQPKAIWGTLQLPFPSEEDWKKRLADPERMYGLLACVEGEPVGLAALMLSTKSPRRRHVGAVGMAVHDQWQGRGAGSALMQALVGLADNWLGLTRLELDVWTDNEPALKLYRKFGFEIEGTQRKFAFRDGAYVDAYRMARVR